MRLVVAALCAMLAAGCIETNHQYGPFTTGPFNLPPGPESAWVRCGSDADCQHLTKDSLAPGWVCRFPYGGYPPGGGLEHAVCTPPPDGWVADSDPSYPPLPGLR
jgi:hypothetical protein